MVNQILADLQKLRYQTDLPPGPPGLPFVGHLTDFRHDPLGFLDKLARDYGDIVFIEIAGKPVYIINKPEHIQELLINNAGRLQKALALEVLKPVFGQGLLTSEGDFHKQQRKLSAPAFARTKLTGYAQTMIDLAENLNRELASHKRFDMHEAMMRLTLKIVAKTLFGSDVEKDSERVAQAIEDIMAITDRILNPLGPVLNALPTPKTLRFHAAVKDLDEIIFRIIAQKKAEGIEGNDLLSTLMAVRDEDGQPMSDKQLRDECLTIFLAGHETTANALSWTWYLLSQHPQVQQKLEEEWAQFANKEKLSPEDYPRLVYTKQVISESFRVYPPAWMISRQIMEDIPLGGYTIPKGVMIVMSQWAVHHNPKYWPAPYTFDPERFAPEHMDSRHKFTFFPFGGGVRQCIGDQFAWMEAVLLLATIGRKFRFSTVSSKPPRPQPLITLRPAGGLPMYREIH